MPEADRVKPPLPKSLNRQISPESPSRDMQRVWNEPTSKMIQSASGTFSARKSQRQYGSDS